MRSLALLFAFLFHFASALAQVTASFNPPSAEVGDTVTYAVTFDNVGQLPEGLQSPSVAGLIFSSGYGSSSQMTIVNGRMSQKISASWQARTTREGTFTVPARTIVASSGATLTIPAASLAVTPVSQERRDAIFWEINLPEGGQKPFLVGERVPATVSLFVRSDHLVASRIKLGLTSEAISFEAGEINQSNAQKNGQSYQRRDWKGFLTLSKSGEHELTFGANVDIIVPGRGISQQELTSPPFKVVVTPLPLDGRPDHFDGAVGQYRLSQQQGSTQILVGDVLSVTLELAGNGDLQGSAGPGFPAADGLKIYPGRNPAPEPDEQGRIAATYTFTVIPSKAGKLTLPAARFAYFDSAARQYVNLSTKPLSLEVSPSAASAAVGSPAASPDKPSGTTPPPQIPTSYELNFPTLGATSSLVPTSMLGNPSFLSLQLVPALAIIGLILLGTYRRRVAKDPYWALGRARRASLRQWSSEAARAARAGDREAFRVAARRWLQYVAAPARHSEPSALSALEIAGHLNASNSTSEIVQDITQRLSNLESPVFLLGDLAQELKSTETLAHRLAAAKG